VTCVLVVDDEPQIRRALNLNLAARGFDVIEANDGEQAIDQVESKHPDLILLDLGLPRLDGIGVLETLRTWTHVPTIVLTVRDDERSKVRALEAGADDYVTKPFGMAELVARMRAVLRRSVDNDSPLPEVTTSAFRLDLAGHRAFVAPDTQEVRLTPTEWGMVIHLVRNPERLITYRQLLTAVWEASYDPDPNLLRVHMAHIRRKLEPDPSRPRYFITDSGVGYRYQPDSVDVNGD
jgi:two-component system KDP operon response regulator KdpE